MFNLLHRGSCIDLFLGHLITRSIKILKRFWRRLFDIKTFHVSDTICILCTAMELNCGAIINIKVVFYNCSNFVIGMLITKATFSRINTFIMWSTCPMTLIRFINTLQCIKEIWSVPSSNTRHYETKIIMFVFLWVAQYSVVMIWTVIDILRKYFLRKFLKWTELENHDIMFLWYW